MPVSADTSAEIGSARIPQSVERRSGRHVAAVDRIVEAQHRELDNLIGLRIQTGSFRIDKHAPPDCRPGGEPTYSPRTQSPENPIFAAGFEHRGAAFEFFGGTVGSKDRIYHGCLGRSGFGSRIGRTFGCAKMAAMSCSGRKRRRRSASAISAICERLSRAILRARPVGSASVTRHQNTEGEAGGHYVPRVVSNWVAWQHRRTRQDAVAGKAF
jgi:hypothetical protein